MAAREFSDEQIQAAARKEATRQGVSPVVGRPAREFVDVDLGIESDVDAAPRAAARPSAAEVLMRRPQVGDPVERLPFGSEPEPGATLEPAGFWGSVGRGLMESQGYAYGMTPGGQAPSPMAVDYPATISEIQGAPSRGDVAMALGAQASGVADATNRRAAVGAALGRELPMALASTPGALGVMAPTRAATAATGAMARPMGESLRLGASAMGSEFLLSNAAVSIMESAKQAGASPAEQIGMGVIGTMMLPNVAIPNNLRRASRSIAAAGRQGLPDNARLLDDTARELLARKYNMAPEEVEEAAAIYKGMFNVSPDPTNPDKYLDRAFEQLKEGERLFPDEATSPPPRAFFGREAGQKMASTVRLMGSDPAMGPVMGGRIEAAREFVEDLTEAMRPATHSEALSQAMDKTFRSDRQGVSRLWSALDMDEMPTIDARKLYEIAMDDYRVLAGKTNRPDEIDMIVEGWRPYQTWEDVLDAEGNPTGQRNLVAFDVPAYEYQALMSDVLATRRANRNPLASKKEKQQSARVGEIEDELRAQFDALPEEGSAEYLAARQASARLHEKWNLDNPIIETILKKQDPGRVVQGMRADGMRKNAEAALRTIGQDPAGLDAVRYALFQHIFGEEFMQHGPKAMRNKLRQVRPLVDVFFGEYAPGNRIQPSDLEDLIRRTELVQDAPGAAGQASQPGSNLWSQAIRYSLAPSEMLTDAGKGVLNMAGNRLLHQEMRNSKRRTELLYDALGSDRETAMLLLSDPTPASMPAWRMALNQTAGRARMRRQAATTTSGRQAAEEGLSERQRTAGRAAKSGTKATNSRLDQPISRREYDRVASMLARMAGHNDPSLIPDETVAQVIAETRRRPGGGVR